MAVGTFLLRTQIIFAREPLVSIRRRADIIEAMSFMKTILNLLRSKLVNCLSGFQPSGLMIYRFFPLIRLARYQVLPCRSAREPFPAKMKRCVD